MTQNLRNSLYESLVQLDVIDEKTLLAARDASKSLEEFVDSLTLLESISEDNLGKLVADLYNVPYVRLSQTPIDDSVFFLLPELMAREHQIVLYKVTDEAVFVATTHPENTEVFEAIRKKVGKPVKITYATKKDITDILSRYSWDISKIIEDLVTEFLEKQKTSNDENLESPVVRIVDALFEYGVKQKASDIHIEPEPDKVFVRFRIDGILHDIVTLPRQLFAKIVTRIKVQAKLRTDEHQSAQDGKIRITDKAQEVDIRVSVVPTTNGEKIVMRLLSEQSRRFVLAELGLSSRDFERVQKAQEKPYGLILATGPTGSGKTTTLYAVLKLLNERDVNIMTVEDPVEYDISGVNQIQVNPKTNLTFADGLRSIVRQDPDIILVGEIRDHETAGIAVDSAMTGHLVLSSLHTNDAATALPRLVEMGVEPFLVASSVTVIIAQRLVRNICMSCRVSVESSPEEVNSILTAAKLDTGKKNTVQTHFGEVDVIRTYAGKGCDACHGSGFHGRSGIFEVLEVSETIKELISNSADASKIHVQALKDGMTPMFEDGIRKVKQGITTLEEVVRVTKE